VVHFGPRVGVLVADGEDILLVRQYRFLVDGPSWEIPGGKVEEGETPEQAATRECLEETGLTCRDFEKLLVYYPGLDNVQNRTTVLHARSFERRDAFISQDNEVQEITWLPLTQCLAMISSEEILDALTVTAILGYAAKLRGPSS
jgi:ADP-ribose pyrophosphatase